MIIMINPKYLKIMSTWEGFFLLSIYYLTVRTTLYSTESHWCYSHLQPQVRPVQNTEDRELDNMCVLFTCSPLLVRKLVQPWFSLGVIRSGREPRYLPSESYLSQKENENNDHDGLNTCPPSHGHHCYHNPQSWWIHCGRRLHRFDLHHFLG